MGQLLCQAQPNDAVLFNANIIQFRTVLDFVEEHCDQTLTCLRDEAKTRCVASTRGLFYLASPS